MLCHSESDSLERLHFVTICYSHDETDLVPVFQEFEHLLFQVEFVEYLHSAVQDLIYIVNTLRVAFHSQVDERHLKRDHVF